MTKKLPPLPPTVRVKSCEAVPTIPDTPENVARAIVTTAPKSGFNSRTQRRGSPELTSVSGHSGL